MNLVQNMIIPKIKTGHFYSYVKLNSKEGLFSCIFSFRPSSFPWKNSPKQSKFQNWLKTHPNVINAQNKCLFHHFGGMLAWKSGLGFSIRALENPFLGTWKWALLPKVPIFRCPKMGFGVPESKNWDHFFTPTSPQNGGVGVCFIHLPLLDA